MDDDWSTVRLWARGMDICEDSVRHIVDRACQDNLTPEDVLDRFARSLDYWTTSDEPESSLFADFEATPPGRLDLRVLDQQHVWVDVLRRSHQIADLSDDHLANIIGWLQHFSVSLSDGWARMHKVLRSLEPAEWLQTTALMKALLTESRRRTQS